jgi:two-component system, OmpR family, phosphate regulon sensor histidine kinase PhoR
LEKDPPVEGYGARAWQHSTRSATAAAGKRSCNAVLSWQNRRAVPAGDSRKGRGEIRWTSARGRGFCSFSGPRDGAGREFLPEYRRLRLRSPTTRFLNRARLVFTLTALIPTILTTAIGIILLAIGESKSMAVVGGILLLIFCAVGLAGYIIGTIFVTRGASLAAVQNEFLSQVSHELRTPLTSIRMFIDTLREERVQDDEEKRRCLSIINQELGRLDGLVGRLIELSKIEHRHAVFDRRNVTVADIVADALASFEAIKVGSEVELCVKLEPDLVVFGDRAALAQAVSNLLGNAWKYTPSMGKKIDIVAAADAKHVTITVGDNGEGIKGAEADKIFEKFSRGAAAKRRGIQGTGLGLAIVRAVVEAHQGKVDVKSTEGDGARFRIVLPRRKEAA